MSRAETAIVVEHALSSRENLGLAIDVAHAFGEIRKELLTKGMQEVERLVRGCLGTEHLHIDNGLARDPLAQYAGFSVRREAWLPGVHVALEAQNTNARSVIRGVWCDPGVTVDVPSTATLSEVLGRPGKASATWPWYVYLKEAYRNLDGKEALLAFWPLTDGSSDAAAFLSDRIVSMVNAVDELLTD